MSSASTSDLLGRTSDETNHSDENMRQDGFDYEQELLEELQLDTNNPAACVEAPWSAKFASRVLVKRYSKADEGEIAKAQREIAALLALKDDNVQELLDYFDPSGWIWVVTRDRADVSLRRYVEGSGAMAEGMLKSVVTQLFSAVASVFMAGFAHLRICDETLFIDPEGVLTIKGFEYAHVYAKEKDEENGLYAATRARYGSDIYTPPEAFAKTVFNARKATIWGCGVSLYYMVTGQTDKLSNLDHPVFENSVSNSNASPVLDPVTPDVPAPSSRRASLASITGRRRSSNPNSGSHSRKVSLTQPPNMVTYPGSRLETPSYIRDIISKMLIINPHKRAELIEVAAKVPKEVRAKGTRPVMELAWLDYKTHVGPLAGLDQLDLDDRGSVSSSLFSGVSNMSNPFASLLGGGGRRSSASVMRRWQ